MPICLLPDTVEFLNFELAFFRGEVNFGVFNICSRLFSARVEVLVVCLVVCEDIGRLADEVVKVEGNLQLSASVNGDTEPDQIDDTENNATGCRKDIRSEESAKAALSGRRLQRCLHGIRCFFPPSIHRRLFRLRLFDSCPLALLGSGADAAAADRVLLTAADAEYVAAFCLLLVDALRVPDHHAEEDGHHPNVEEDDAHGGEEAEGGQSLEAAERAECKGQGICERRDCDSWAGMAESLVDAVVGSLRQVCLINSVAHDKHVIDADTK